MMTNFSDRTIWTGDNLDILRGLNSASIDLIYLDPPFNSNRNYAAPVGSTAAGAAFKDTWTLSDLDVAWMGLIADEQPAMYQVLQAAGLTHGKGMQSYLCMMAVRLVEMRRVLTDTGSIYLHCDPTASHYLKLLMDSIYGQNNFRSEITWRRNLAKGLASKGYPKKPTPSCITAFPTNLPGTARSFRMIRPTSTSLIATWIPRRAVVIDWIIWQTPMPTDLI